jgi:uncharacterized protein (DUF1501 family)
MDFINNNLHTRRAFLRRAGQLALAGTATPLAINLAAMGEAAAFSATDYKALVCIFLTGGNDHANTVVPFDASNHAKYLGLRGSTLGLQKGSLAATELRPTAALAGGLQYALHPNMPDVARVFNAGRLGVQLNVGPLIVPMTRKEYDARILPQPPKLFSHNDQQSIWQAQGPEGTTRGWGGNIGDLAWSGNGQSLFTCISVSGNTVFLSGQNALQYQCSKAGAVAYEAVRGSTYGQFFYEPAMRSAFEQLISQAQSHVLAESYNVITRRSLGAEQQVNAAINSVNLTTAFPTDNTLADQLKVVARLIGGRTSLNLKRQVFMVTLDGFDTHDNMLSRHAALLRKLSTAMGAFDSAMTELGISNQVTTFTASDFGRALSPNNAGTDHGWGGHQFVMGGAVKGSAFYGTPPPLSVGNTSAPEDQWHVGQGRLLPSTSVDQYAATLARWFGVADTELYQILPNLVHFGDKASRPDYPVNLGFLG